METYVIPKSTFFRGKRTRPIFLTKVSNFFGAEYLKILSMRVDYNVIFSEFSNGYWPHANL